MAARTRRRGAPASGSLANHIRNCSGSANFGCGLYPLRLRSMPCSTSGHLSNRLAVCFALRAEYPARRAASAPLKPAAMPSQNVRFRGNRGFIKVTKTAPKGENFLYVRDDWVSRLRAFLELATAPPRCPALTPRVRAGERAPDHQRTGRRGRPPDGTLRLRSRY